MKRRRAVADRTEQREGALHRSVKRGRGLRGTAMGTVMDQRYVDTVRACKVILHNMDYLNDTMTAGQRAEFARVALRVREGLNDFLETDHADEGLWIGEE